MGREADKSLRRLADALVWKWEKRYSWAIDWVRAYMSVSVIRATNFCFKRIKDEMEISTAWQLDLRMVGVCHLTNFSNVVNFINNYILLYHIYYFIIIILLILILVNNHGRFIY